MGNLINQDIKFELPDGFDISRTVPRSTIMCAIIAMLVVLAVGVMLFFWIKKRERVNGFGFFGGIATYMTFYYLGVSVIANLIVRFLGTSYLTLLLLALVAAGLPMLGRVLAMKMFAYKMNKVADSLSFGVGIMASEGLMSIVNFFMIYISANTVNKVGVEQLLADAATQEEFNDMIASVLDIIDYEPVVIIGLVVTGISCMVFHLASSVPLFAAYQGKLSKGFYVFTAGTYFAMRLFMYMTSARFLNQIFGMILVALGAALFTVTSVRIYKTCYKDEEKDGPQKKGGEPAKKKIPRFENLSKL